jgi:hypothetical protein
MGVAIGGHRIVTAVTTIPTRGHTVARITGATVIIIQRLTMILPRELTDGNRLLMGRTGRQQEGLVTILTPALMREARGFRHLMGVEAQHRHITRTREPMLRRGRVRARTLSGVVPTCREETRALPWAITRQGMERWRAPLVRREEKWPLLARSGGTVRLVKLPAVICTLGTMVMCTRIRVMAGRSTIMEAGTLQVSPSLTGKGQKIASNGLGARVISSGRLQRVATIEPAVGAAPTVQGEAVSIGPVAAVADSVIWIARLRTGRVVIFRASVSRAFKAAALIDLEVVGDLGVIALAAGDSVAAVIASAAAALAGLAGSAAAAEGSEAGDEIMS